MIDKLTLDELNTIIDIFGFKPSDVSIIKCKSDGIVHSVTQFRCVKSESEVVFMSIDKFSDSTTYFAIQVFDETNSITVLYYDIADIDADDFNFDKIFS